MKTIVIFLLFILFTYTSFSQNAFNCTDFDYYNRDTNLIVQYQIVYDSITNSDIEVLTTIEDKRLVDTIQIPRYMVHFSENDSKRLDRLILCCLDWLLTCTIDSDEKTWKNVEKFVRSSCLVSGLANDKIIKKLESEVKNDELIRNYYNLGVIRHITLKTYEPDDVQIQLAGLFALNKLYSNNPNYINDMPKILVDYNKKNDREILIKWIRKFRE